MAANSIITLAQAREYLNKVSGETAQDTFIQSCIDINSDAIERYINGPVVEQTFTDEIYDGPGTDHLYVRNWPVTALKNGAITDVQYRTAPDASWQTLETTLNFILIKKDKPWAIWLYATYFFSGQQNIKVSYKAGYNSVPQDFVRVCLEMVAEMYKESSQGDGRLGRSSLSNNAGGVGTTDSFFELSDRHRRILSKYRKVRV